MGMGKMSVMRLERDGYSSKDAKMKMEMWIMVKHTGNTNVSNKHNLILELLRKCL
jgi:hypothetical protein